MSLVFETYDARWVDACVEIFQSNADPYFAAKELDQFKAFLRDDGRGAFFVLIEQGSGRAIACGGYAPQGDAIVLTWGMVARDQHGRGYGQRLLVERLTRIRQQHGPVDVVIDTSQHTQGFFAKYGFGVVKVTENGFCPGLHKVAMVLTGEK